MYRVLEILRNTTDYVSGENIGKMLGVTRASVWKHIRQLRNEGYQITSVTNKGYLLTENDILSENIISSALTTKDMGRNTHFFLETDSTNTQLKLLGSKNAPHGTLVIAESMTHGRGRLGRVWQSPKFTGLWFSLLLRPNIPPQNASVITLLAGIAVSRGIEKVTHVKTDIKWPNDILLNGKKICGILTEMDCEMDKTNFVILGIGVNVNTKIFPDDLSDIATSIFIETGVIYSRLDLLNSILNELEIVYSKFIAKSSGFSSFARSYQSMCINIGRNLQVIGTMSDNSFTGVGVGITEDGGLLVKRDSDGCTVVVTAGEVSIRNT